MTTRATSPSFSITIRLRIDNRIGMLAKVVTAISAAGGDIGSVDIVGVDRKHITRDVTINSRNEEHEKEILMIVGKLPESRSCRQWTAPLPPTAAARSR